MDLSKYLMQSEKEKILGFIAKRLKEIREKKELTQFELLVDSVDIRIIQRIEAGKTDIRISTLIKITNKLEISLSDFFDKELKIRAKF